MRRGDFVLCNFPFHGHPGPGPSPHVVLCVATGQAGTGRFAIVFYTTTQIEFAGSRRPRQYIYVDAGKARALNQHKAFHIDTSRIARLPVNRAYFPAYEAGAVPIIGNSLELADSSEERLRQLLSDGVAIRRIDEVPPGR